METKVYSAYDDYFRLLAIITLVILLVDVFIAERKNHRLSKVKLF